MGPGRLTVRDLLEEAKKRAALLLVCAFGLAYLMSLTSSSVWFNLPAAAAIIMVFRYISWDLDVRRRTIASNTKSTADPSAQRRSVELFKYTLENSNWRMKVNSPAVEVAIMQFTKHLTAEWVTDLWYSRLTTDRDAPEELVQIMNGILGEISYRARDVNLIDLLTRDMINLICNHLELYRSIQAKIGCAALEKLSVDSRDSKLKLVLAEEKKLHPALFSAESEHKVLQHLMDGLISSTFRPQELQCTFFRYMARELLACVVIRPVLNFANPRFINEKIETLVLSRTNKAEKGAQPPAAQAPRVKNDGPSKMATVQFSGNQGSTTVGVELVQLKNGHSKANEVEMLSSTHTTHFVKDLDDHDRRLTDNSSFLPSDSQSIGEKRVGASNSVGEWAQKLDVIAKRKTHTLAPEHFENVWTKGCDYKRKDDAQQIGEPAKKNISQGISNSSTHPALPSNHWTGPYGTRVVNGNASSMPSEYRDFTRSQYIHANSDVPEHTSSYEETIKRHVKEADDESLSDSSHLSDDDENNSVTGLDSPGTIIWDSKNKKNASDSRIRHPLEAREVQPVKKHHARHPRTTRTSSGRKRTRSSNQKAPLWHEVERTSFPLRDGLDILRSQRQYAKVDDIDNKVEAEVSGIVHGLAAASMSLDSSLRSSNISLLADSFLKLRCEVSGASIVKSGSGTFAVYSIFVTDANNNSWSIKRRFRHFEELHKRLKEFSEYNLSLPPKHFLSSGLEETLVNERCRLLNKYLKNLLQLPTVSGSIEVWDFLSVDSQTYIFLNSLTIIQALPVDHDMKPSEKNLKDVQHSLSYPKGDYLNPVIGEHGAQMSKKLYDSENFGLRKRKIEQNMGMSANIDCRNVHEENSGSDSEKRHEEYKSSRNPNKPLQETSCSPSPLEASQIPETDDDSSIPTEWVPPNLSVPILDLVDVIFQLQDGGWIRRQAFWVAKQLLQLGMGDAFDDWLIEKIQLLRKGSVIASSINRLEQILWPDGIFLTKHPNRKARTPVASPKEGGSQNSTAKENLLSDEQQLEAARRAKFVHELIIDKAPSALVSLVGRKEYERCAQDVYFFVQSEVCMKQLALELLELLLLAAFPELEDVIRKCHEEKDEFMERRRT